MKKIILLLSLFCLSFSCLAAEKKFSTLEGETISYEKIIAQPKSILFIWATWCPSCRRELTKLFQKRIFFEGVDVWYVNTGESKSIVDEFVKVKKITDSVKKKIICDKKSRIANKFSVAAIPTYLFFKDSELVFKSYFLNDNVLKKAFGSQ